MRPDTLIRGFTWALALSLTLTAAASAQRRSSLREVTEWGVAGLTGGIALQETSQQSDPVVEAGGGSAFMTVFFDSWGLLALRLEGSLLVFSDERATTGNPVFLTGFHMGPQITLGKGILRPYGFGQIGFSYLFSEAPFNDCYCETDSGDLHDFDWSGTLGAGMMLRLGGRNSNSHLDLGARFLYGADSEFSGAASSTSPTGAFQHEASVSVVYLGFSFALRN